MVWVKVRGSGVLTRLIHPDSRGSVRRRPRPPPPHVAVLRRATVAAALLLAAHALAAMPAEAGEPAFRVSARSGAARAGELRGGLETPAVLLYTRRGFPAPLTLRELKSLSEAVPGSGSEPAPLGVQVSAAELLDEPGAAILRKVPGGLKEFCGLHGRNDLVLLSAHDSLTIQAGMPASDGWATLQTPAGQKKVLLCPAYRCRAYVAASAAHVRTRARVHARTCAHMHAFEC